MWARRADAMAGHYTRRNIGRCGHPQASADAGKRRHRLMRLNRKKGRYPRYGTPCVGTRVFLYICARRRGRTPAPASHPGCSLCDWADRKGHPLRPLGHRNRPDVSADRIGIRPALGMKRFARVSARRKAAICVRRANRHMCPASHKDRSLRRASYRNPDDDRMPRHTSGILGNYAKARIGRPCT